MSSSSRTVKSIYLFVSIYSRKVWR